MVALRSDEGATHPPDGLRAASGGALPVPIAPAHEAPAYSRVHSGSVGIVLHGSTVRPGRDGCIRPLRMSRRTVDAVQSAGVVEWLMVPDPSGRDLRDLAHLIDRPEWFQRAACRGMGTGSFFPVRGGTAEAARAVCDTCVVRADCLSYAMSEADTVGRGPAPAPGSGHGCDSRWRRRGSVRPSARLE